MVEIKEVPSCSFTVNRRNPHDFFQWIRDHRLRGLWHNVCVFTLMMKPLPTFLRFACASILAGVLSSASPTSLENRSALLPAQSSSDQPAPVELEQFLFVQAPERDNSNGAIVVIWLPPSLVKLCLGKTATQCSAIDYCIRTTNRESSQCKNIGVNLARIPPYPAGTRPPRMMSIVLSRLEPTKFKELQDFYHSAPQASLQRISMRARIKARIRFTKKTNFDDLTLLEVLAVPPF